MKYAISVHVIRIAFLVLILTLLSALFGGCATKPVPQQASRPDPMGANTSALQGTLLGGKEKAGSASNRTQTIIREVERIKSVTDPQTAQALESVRGELFKVQIELRETMAAFLTAESQRIEAQSAADASLSWGKAQQATSIANAQGWENASKEAVKWHTDADKQRGLAWKWRGLAVGTWAVLAAVLLGRFYLKSQTGGLL